MFWRATFYEFTAALTAREPTGPSGGMDAARLDELMTLYPD